MPTLVATNYAVQSQNTRGVFEEQEQSSPLVLTSAGQGKGRLPRVHQDFCPWNLGKASYMVLGSPHDLSVLVKIRQAVAPYMLREEGSLGPASLISTLFPLISGDKLRGMGSTCIHKVGVWVCMYEYHSSLSVIFL